MPRSPVHCLAKLHKEFEVLRKLDFSNQQHYSKLLLAGKRPRLTKAQIHLLTEGLFSNAFRCYQLFLNEVFLLYCTGRYSCRKKRVKSFLNAKNILHAKELIQSSMPYLDWSNPNTVLDRAELYLQDGYPIKQSIATNREGLLDLERVRNHIAHMSDESKRGYLKTLKNHFGVDPLRVPPPGKYLLLPHRTIVTQYYLLYYFDLIERVSGLIV